MLAQVINVDWFLSNSSSFIKIIVNYCGSFALLYKFQNNVVYMYKNPAEFLIGILLYLYIEN